MRVRLMVLSLAALVGAVGVEAPAEAQVRNWCYAIATDNRHFYSGVIRVPGYETSSTYRRRMTADFREHLLTLVPRFYTVYCYDNNNMERSITSIAAAGFVVVRTGWTGNYMAEAGSSGTVRPGAGREPGVYIMPPTVPGATPAVDNYHESEESRRAVAARYRQQQERERAIADDFARRQAAHQAQVAEAARQRSAHQAAMAQNARQQEAYRRARAEWEARVAACRAGNRDACVARVTQQ